MKKNTPATKAIVILGPTSSGKSAIAIALAKKFCGEVVSADSRQIFKDMNLGTGKVEGKWVSPNLHAPSQSPPRPQAGSLESRGKTGKVFVSEAIPHHLLDFRSPRGKYNVSHFQKDCPGKIEQIAKRAKLPIICGGTGFWISALIDGISLPQVAPNEKLRKKLDKKTNGELLAMLEKLDPHRAKTVDQKNKIRLIRAIEICKAIGKVPSLPLSISSSDRGRDSEFLQIGIDWPQEVLDQKIKKRLESRWTDGMIAEVENLKKKYGLSWKKIQSFGLAYFWIPLFLQGKMNKEELKEKVFHAERGYAKRQRTWFKRDKRIVWENDLGKIEKLVEDFLK